MLLAGVLLPFWPAGKYAEAAEKYERAKANTLELSSPEAQALRKACTLNLGSCYLNMGKYQQCVTECQEVLRGERAPQPRGTAWYGSSCITGFILAGVAAVSR